VNSINVKNNNNELEKHDVIEIKIMEHVFPYFYPTFMLIFAHIFYFYTGKLLILVWLLFLAIPIHNLTNKDNKNLSK
jgi:hypothetical protein